MREDLIKSLIKDVLGPRDGVYEEMKEDPSKEYVTGIINTEYLGNKCNRGKHTYSGWSNQSNWKWYDCS